MSIDPAVTALTAFEDGCDRFTGTARKLVNDPELTDADVFTALVKGFAQPSVTHEILLGTLAVALMRLAKQTEEWGVRVDEPHPLRRWESAGDILTHFPDENARRSREVWKGFTPIRRSVGPWEPVGDAS